MIREGDRLLLQGPVTFSQTPALLTAGLDYFRQGVRVIDFKQVTEVDSSTVSLLLAWRRHAKEHDLTLHIVNLPRNLLSLAELYGLADLLLSPNDNAQNASR